MNFDKIISNSSLMQEICEVIQKVSASDSTVLILGESGTGKELVAKTIHHNSARKDFPFVPLNCGAIPHELLESELFGHEKGAFTGACALRQGRFERAHRGTIFLDEIGEMSLPLQVKLLRVLQEMEFERIGSNRTIRVDVRVIAATNCDLEAAVRKGIFRKDLYYRLDVIPIVIPPLRKRKADIPQLARYFLNLMIRQKKRYVTEISDRAMDILINYSWPGNIRELKNVIERIMILKQDKGPIVPHDLPLKMIGQRSSDSFFLEIPEGGINLNRMLVDIENRFIEKALNKSGGIKTRAAALLGINRTTLIEKMKRNGMKVSSSQI